MRTVKQKTAKPAEEPALPPASDRLLGVPGLGPIRITALHAAGITTRAQLAQSSVEQLISMTGMPRTQAEKTLAAVRGTASVATTPPPPTDELMPTPGILGESADRPEPTDPEPDLPPASDLDRALLTARTALSDATRHFPALDRPLIKFAIRLEKLPRQAAGLTEKKQAKIAARLDKLDGVSRKGGASFRERYESEARAPAKASRIGRRKVDGIAPREKRSEEKRQAKAQKIGVDCGIP